MLCAPPAVKFPSSTPLSESKTAVPGGSWSIPAWRDSSRLSGEKGRVLINGSESGRSTNKGSRSGKTRVRAGAGASPCGHGNLEMVSEGGSRGGWWDWLWARGGVSGCDARSRGDVHARDGGEEDPQCRVAVAAERGVGDPLHELVLEGGRGWFLLDRVPEQDERRVVLDGEQHMERGHLFA